MKIKIAKKFLAAILSISLLLQIGGPVVYAGGGSNPTVHTYDISEGAINITEGTNSNTFKVVYGGGVSDNISLSQPITIFGNAVAGTEDNITIEGVKVTIVLDNVYLKTNVDRAFKSPMSLISGADLTLKLKGTSTLHSSSRGAGINVSGGTTLTITSNNGDGSMDGTLNAIAEGSDLNAMAGIFHDGAGIGATGVDATTTQTLGTINIKGGTVNATGGGGGAGIGGSIQGTTGTINISGGKIIAKAGDYGSNGSTAIGGGARGYVSQINITGGDIQAIGGHKVPGIGGGYSINNSGEINISGGKIDAKGKDSPVSIGYNVNPDESDRNGSIKITGGDINLNGGSMHPEATNGTQTLKQYQLDIIINDGRLIGNIENTSVKIDGKVYNGKINVAEKCVGTISVLALIPATVTEEKDLSITAGSYNWTTKVAISGTSSAIPVTIGEKLYPVYLWFYDSSITEDITGVSYELKRNGSIPSASNDSIKSYQSDGKIVKTADGVGRMTIYMISGDKTDISVTANSLNGGAMMAVTDQNIKRNTVGTNIIMLDSTDTAQLAEAIDLFYGNITFEHEESTGKLKITYSTDTGQKTLNKQRYQNEFRIIQSDNETVTENSIIVKNTVEFVNIDLEGVNIKPTEGAVSPIRLESAKANLYLVGDNKVDASGTGYAAVNVDGGSEINFDGTGKIEVMTPSGSSAGIGGNGNFVGVNSSTGKITIKGGTIISRGNNGAAIGTGLEATSNNYGSIYITGGIVKAYSGEAGAAIGGGSGARPSNVYISGGTVHAEALSKQNNETAAIGGGYISRSGGEIFISGGYVEAKATKGPAIGSGGGWEEDTQAICPPIKISGGTLKLTGKDAEIGISASQSANTNYPDGKGLTISGGSIFKESGGQARIGGSLPRDGTTDVYYTKADVLDVYGSDSHIEDASITDISYGLDDVKTDGDGILHMYLPVNTGIAATHARFADDYYKGIVTSTEATNELKKLISFTGATINLTLPGGGYIYNGTEKNPGINVSLGGNTINSDDYDVSYFNTNGGAGNHTNAGTVNVIVTGKNNYVASASKSFEIAKSDQSNLSITAVDGKKYGDAPFALATTGGTGNGQVSYSLPTDNGVLSVSGSTATIIGVGTVTLTATKVGEGGNYNSITATREITISKMPAPTISFPTASNITYGQKLSESTLEGGNTDLGSFAWTVYSLVPNVGDQQCGVTFTPNDNAIQNYQDMEIKTENVSIIIDKSNPPVSVTADVYAETGSRGLVLTAILSKVGDGVTPTGTINFVNTTSGSAIYITGATDIENGIATYTWTGLEEGIYKVQAVYSGDNNYIETTSNESTFDTSKQNQTNFNISDIEDKTYGDSSFTLSATGGDGTGDISFESSDAEILSIEGNTASILKAGNVQITATKAGDDDYNEATETLSLTIDKKALNIKADDKLNIIRGQSMPEFTYTLTGIVGGDSFATEPTITVIDGDINRVGEYIINISGAVLYNSDSYIISYTNGKLNVVEALYRVTVTNGTGTGTYSQGQTVIVAANDQNGYTFTQWTSTEGLEFEDKTAITTSFTMPNKAVNITANYSKDSSGDNTGGGSSDSGGSSGGSSSSGESSNDITKDEDTAKDKDTTRVETIKESNAPTKVIVSTSSKVTKGTVNIEVSKSAVKDAIEKAQEAAKKNGTEEYGISVEIKVDTKNTNVSNLSANIPRSTLEDLTKAGVKNLSINSVLTVINLDLETLKTIRDKIDGDANLSVKKVDNNTLSAEIQKMVGSRPVFDFSITGENGEKVSEFGKGKISVSIPYTLGPDEKAENLAVYYINEDGKIEGMPNSVYDEKSGTLSFETDHFSKFAVGYKEDADIITFTDIANHWAKANIEFVTARGLFTGTGEDKFSPNMSMTRGMFVTVLGRLAIADISIYKASGFIDVKTDAYYMPYTEWASEIGIVEGINQDNFGPDMPITREQIAVILYRYCNYKDYDTTQGGMAIREFTDYETISDYALQSMGWTVNTGLLQGSDNKLMPKDNATRAEVAAILMRFSQIIEE